MASKTRLLVLLPMLALLLFASFAIPAYAVPPTTSTSSTAAETGWVHYFTTSGGVCTSTVWPNVATDGNVGFPNNVGGPQPTAVVDLGQTICIKIEVNNFKAINDTLYAWVQAQSAIVSASTNSTNGADFTIIWTNTNDVAAACGTVPIFIGTHSPPNSGPDSDKEDVGHLIYGPCGGTTTTTTTTSTPQGVPEFPIAGALGTVLLAAILVPVLVGLRRWKFRV